VPAPARSLPAPNRPAAGPRTRNDVDST
jgi:hypothetical protein